LQAAQYAFDALTIAKAIGRSSATLFCGTSTFLRLLVLNRRIQLLMLIGVDIE
jgi:hypothetical protein